MRKEILRFDQVTCPPDLKNVNFTIYEGEIDGLIGIDSLGLDYLVDTIQHNLPLHYGWVYYNEIKVNDYCQTLHTANKIVVLQKKNSLIGTLSVAENLFIIRNGYREHLINYKMIRQQTQMILSSVGLQIDPARPAAYLSTCEKWILELAKAWISGVKLVILRDVENLVTENDLSRIFNVMHILAGHKMSFLYICSHHQAAFRICDRCFLMKQGRLIRCLDKSQMTDEIMRHYLYAFNNRVADAGRRRYFTTPDTGTAEGFYCRMDNFEFSLKKGETVVILDTDDKVITSFFRKLKSNIPARAVLRIDGKPWKYGSRKYALIVTHPLETMLCQQLSVLDNLCLPFYNKMKNFWPTKTNKEALAKDVYPVFGDTVYASSLYGLDPAILYDIIYLRTFILHPSFLCVVQPFASVDMLTRLKLLSYFDKFRERGITVCILSYSLSDFLQVADRMIVVRDGRVQNEYLQKDFQLYSERSGSNPC